MGIFDGFEKDIEKKSLQDVGNEINERIQNITRDEIIEEIIKHGKEKLGKIFKTDAQAREWAERYFEKELINDQLKRGTPVCCDRCGKAKCDKSTGPLIKIDDNIYRHKECNNESNK